MTLKRRNYTGSLKYSENDIDRVISVIKQYPKYAYITHDKDVGTEKHFHFYIEFPNPRSVTAVADDLGVPCSMLQKVHFERSHILQYLTHKNEDSKFHYDDSEVFTNLPASAFSEPDENQFCEELSDYMKVRNGFMSPIEFVKKYNMYCATLSFYSRISLYSKLCCDIAAREPVRAAGRSSSKEEMEL